MMMRVSTRLYDMCVYLDQILPIRTRLDSLRIYENLDQILMSGYPEIYARDVDKPPVLWYARLVHNTLAHYLQIHYTFYTDSIQITKPNKTLIYI